MNLFKLPLDDAGIPDVIVAMKNLHDCVEAEHLNLEQKIDRNRKASILGLSKLRASVHTIRATQLEIKEALGLTEGTKKPFGLWSPKKVFGWIATIGGCFFIFAKALTAVAPFVYQAAVALWQTAIH